MSTKNLHKALGAAAVMGLAVGVHAAPTTFEAQVKVQNSITVNNDQDMDFGALSVTKADTKDYNWIVLEPDGTLGSAQGNSTIPLISLGGEQAARGSVTLVSNGATFKVKLPKGAADAAFVTGTDTGTDTVDASLKAGALAVNGAELARVLTPANGAVRLSAGGAPTIPRFHLINFRVGDVSGGTAAASCSAAAECEITADWDKADVSFGIGATLVTDVTDAARVSYQETDYSGTFGVEAVY